MKIITIDLENHYIILRCTKVPRCVEEFMVNSIKFKIIISKLVVFPKVSHIFA
jgi:hypothetical protein